MPLHVRIHIERPSAPRKWTVKRYSTRKRQTDIGCDLRVSPVWVFWWIRRLLGRFEALVADLTDVSAHLVSERVVGRVFVGQLGLGIGVQDKDGRAEVRRR